MRISLIATVRNEQDTIAAFLDSLLGQSRAPDEVVIVDGASTDGTLEVLNDYSRRSGVRVISQDCNIAEGRNLGIAAATGTHIAVTDAGCKVDREWLANLARCFEENPEVDIAAGNFRFETHNRFEESVVKATFNPNRENTPSARYYPSSRSLAFTKRAWEAAGGYPEWLYAAEDTLFNIRLRQLGFEFVFCRDAIVYWRPRETWRALARQRINFARGNSRVGIGTSGYLINLRVHGLVAILLLASLWLPWLVLGALLVFAWHVHKHLFQQARKAAGKNDPAMMLRVLVVMEYVRLVSLYGFLRGRWERRREPSFVENQKRYMEVASVEELEAAGVI